MFDIDIILSVLAKNEKMGRMGEMNAFFRFLYIYLLRPVLFCFDPEKIHDIFLKLGNFLGRNNITRKITSTFFSYSNEMLEQKILGIDFKNPVGLAAGFDKNCELVQIMPSVGFGFEEIGSITGKPCSGNPKPRMWRLVDQRSLVVNYGLKNDGCEAISNRLNNKKFEIPVGINIAKTNDSGTVETKDGIKDYVKAYKYMSGIGSYHAINISCPNAFGGEPFTDPEKLKALLMEIEKVRVAAPLLIKLSPDLTHEQIDSILEVSLRHGVNGVICSNLTKKKKNESRPGGISGKVLEEKSNELIKYVYKKTAGQLVIIGCGGIFSAEDAYKKIRLGASLVQLITGMIFEGPQLISEINRGLVGLLRRDGFNHISEVIGMDNRN